MTDIVYPTPEDLGQAQARNQQFFEEYLATFASLHFREMGRTLLAPGGKVHRGLSGRRRKPDRRS
jgi:hypothetical protein